MLFTYALEIKLVNKGAYPGGSSLCQKCENKAVKKTAASYSHYSLQLPAAVKRAILTLLCEASKFSCAHARNVPRNHFCGRRSRSMYFFTVPICIMHSYRCDKILHHNKHLHIYVSKMLGLPPPPAKLLHTPMPPP